MDIYSSAIRMFAGFFRKFYRIRIVGDEHIPKDGAPFLLCCNHINAMDAVVIIAVLKLQVSFVAKEELFRIPLLGGVLRTFGCIPLKRGTGDVGAIKNMIAHIEAGQPVGIFPQGHRNPGVPPRGTTIHHGAGMIVHRTGVRVLPVCIHTKNHKLSPFRQTDIVVGQLIDGDFLLANTASAQSENHTEHYRAMTKYIFDDICAMDELQSEEEALLLP